jgi:hypothetical protein
MPSDFEITSIRSTRHVEEAVRILEEAVEEEDGEEMVVMELS